MLGNETLYMFDRFTVEKNLVGVSIIKDGDRNSPTALAGDAPIRSRLRHCGDAVLPNARQPAYRIDSSERLLAKCIYRSKPLRRSSEDRRLLSAPVVRILVLVLFCCDQCLLFCQRLDDGGVSLAKYRHSLERIARLRGELASVINRREKRQAILLAGKIVLLPMPRRSVDETSAAICGDVIAADYNHTLAFVKRVLVTCSGNFGALKCAVFGE
mmetsp:Transcript_6079/g.10155  ORF Transcript_6079/g.10155 Transcript_6079/m.10155 type:complete len:214 (-) Transcript_6079:1013-1654(-)